MVALGLVVCGVTLRGAEIEHDVCFDLSQWGVNQVTNRKVLITPLSLNAPGGTIAPQDAWMFVSDTNGVFWVSNMLSGTYRGEVQSPPSRTGFDFFVDTTNRTQYAGSNTMTLPSAVNLQDYYTAAQTDAAISNAVRGVSLPGIITNGQGGVTLGGNFTNSLMTNSYMMSPVSEFGPSVVLQGSMSNVFISSVTWDSNIGGQYVLGHLEVSSGGNPIAFLTNGGLYGMVYDTSYDDYPHIIAITNGGGVTIGYLDGIQWPIPETLTTNGHIATGAIVSIGTNSTFIPGFSGTGPFAFDGSGVSNVIASATNILGHPSFDGRSATNTIPPANWSAGLLPVPLLGWNSYEQTSCNVNENEVLAVANLWAANGMRDAGWRWLWIDCGWATTLTNINSNFPHGITNVVKICHGLGFKVGIYLGINGLPYGPGTGLGNTLAGVDAQIFSQAPTIAAWGVDGLKIDGLAAITEIEAHTLESRLFAAAFIAGRTNVLLDLTLHEPGTSELGAAFTPSEVFNNVPMWEVTSAQETTGINPELGVTDFLRPILWANGPGRCGQLFFSGNSGESINTLTNKLNFDLAWPSFLETGNTNASAAVFFTNQDLVSIITDGLVAPNHEVYSNGFCRIWARPLGKPWPSDKYAVLFINGNTNGPASSNLTVTASMLGWTNGTPLYARDPYQQLELGASNNLWTVNVTTQQTALYLFHQSPLPPTVAFNNISNHFSADQFVSGNISGSGLSVNYSSGTISTIADGLAVDVANRLLVDTSGTHSIDFANRYLIGPGGGQAAGWDDEGIFTENGYVVSIGDSFPAANLLGTMPPNIIIYSTNLANRAVYATNANNGVVIDATKAEQRFITNATYTVTGFSGLVSGSQHSFEMTVSNANSSSITWNGPANAFYLGSGSSGSLTIPAGKEAWMQFRIWPNLRTNIQNNGAQQ